MTISRLLAIIPEEVIANCRQAPERQAWLESLPAMLEELMGRWSLRPGPPFEHVNATCSWVAPVIRADGTTAVLKLGMPHMEGASEIEGLRFWNGNPTVQLLDADDDLGAMLLERCQPGYPLRSEPEHQQDIMIATLLKRLWRRSDSPGGLYRFRHLSEMLEAWRYETLAQVQYWPDTGLVQEGLRVLQALAKPSPTDTLRSCCPFIRPRKQKALAASSNEAVGGPGPCTTRRSGQRRPPSEASHADRAARAYMR